MRLFSIRKADIDPELRKTFERYGTVTMQMLLATNATTYRHQGTLPRLSITYPLCCHGSRSNTTEAREKSTGHYSWKAPLRFLLRSSCSFLYSESFVDSQAKQRPQNLAMRSSS